MLCARVAVARTFCFNRSTTVGSVALSTTVDSSPPKTGTIFEDSPLGLDKWLMAMWMVVNCKNGVSSYEIHRAHRRDAEDRVVHASSHPSCAGMDRCKIKLSGEVEVDETFIGGKARNMHADKRERRDHRHAAARTRPPSWASWSAAARFATKVVADRKKKTLQTEVREAR